MGTHVKGGKGAQFRAMAHALLAKAGLGRKGTALRELGQTLNGVTQTVEPF